MAAKKGVKQKVFNDFHAEKFLRKYVDVARHQLVNDFEDIVMKPPLVLKIISDDALHKSDIGGVRIVKDLASLRPQFDDLLRVASEKKLKLEGIMVQEFQDGLRLIVGVKRDEVFGHVILFGMGGVFTEVLDDTSVRKCPISRVDAQEMIDELRSSSIFKGFRGMEFNVEAIKDCLVRVSNIPVKNKGISELDINPLMVDANKAVVVDARMVMDA